MELSWSYLVKNEDVLQRVKGEKNVTHDMKRKKSKWIYKFRVETSSEHVIEGKIEGMRRRENDVKSSWTNLRITKDNSSLKRKH